jgi:predicted DNA-binding transcriptional regulator YafY
MLQIVGELQRAVSGEMQIKRLAEKIGVSRRTMARYIDTMQTAATHDLDLPQVRRDSRARRGWVWLERPLRPPETHDYQYLLAQVGLQVLSTGGQSEYSKTVAQQVASMRTRLGTREHETVRRSSSAFLYRPFGAKRYDQADDVLSSLLLSVLWCRLIGIDYRDRRGNDLSRTLAPFTLVLYRDGLYVLGRLQDDAGDERWRLFAVDRIRSAKVRRDETFEVPDSFDPADLFEHTLGLWPTEMAPADLRLAFSPGVSIDVRERSWPEGRWEDERNDGWSVLRMSVAITPEVIAWIRSWGQDVDVLAPESLREAVAGGVHHGSSNAVRSVGGEAE